MKKNNHVNVSYFSRMHYQFVDMLFYSHHRTFHPQTSQESHIPPPNLLWWTRVSGPPCFFACSPQSSGKTGSSTRPDRCFCNSQQPLPFAIVLQGEQGRSLSSLSSQKATLLKMPLNLNAQGRGKRRSHDKRGQRQVKGSTKLQT